MTIPPRPDDKLSFRHWLINAALQILKEPQYGKMLVKRAVHDDVALPIAICRSAEDMANAVERQLLLGALASAIPSPATEAARKIWEAYDKYASE
ncbi:hypothetical protein SE17_43590 [Kouleothrix aurantiaca]|uniref:Uncharacterized protein n=1 Tax=Kouleothrix aurantiaca TaxID=186479 RepID=A0A0P9CL45_9CHLR|nr:hypothetical protein SE17_43590 [Kouleothrix aurantiaca]